jgi:5-formyltetrahydrofolate cyclo-ligase
VNKSTIRKKILKIRKMSHYKNLIINFNKFFKILDNKKNNNKIIGSYYPYNYEVDTLNILKRLEKKNYKISIPKIVKNNQMNFYEWSFKDPLSINVFGIPEPISEKIVYPDILLVPLVAFDHKLNRLGYGGGYYDRYLARALNIKKIITIGLSYSFQKIKKLPINQFDMKLDYVITEKDVFK